MIELKHVNAGYGHQTVLQDVNAVIHPGKLTVMIGRNGAGKSTLLKTVCGLLPCCSGQIVLDGQDLQSFPPARRARKISMVFQNRNIPAMQVHQLVLHGRFPYLQWPRSYSLKDRMAARQAMETMGILSSANAMLEQLSGGERQKVYLAMALAQDADYVFFDEPASYMDLPSQKELTALMKALKSDGKGVVVIEHDLAHALQHADWILCLHGGRLIFSGTAEQFLEQHLDEQVFKTQVVPVMTKSGQRYLCL